MTPFSKAFCSLSPLPWSLFCSRCRLTGGTENTLFHYVSWDSFHGIVVCPSDGDAPSTSGPVHAEVLNTFHKTCLSMRRLFSPYYKQVSSKTRNKYYALTNWVDSEVSLWVTVLTLHQLVIIHHWRISEWYSPIFQTERLHLLRRILKDRKHNSLHLARKYSRIFVRRH